MAATTRITCELLLAATFSTKEDDEEAMIRE
jgi:hypothetical protein